MAEWGSEPNWTPFEEINGGQQFSKQFGAQDLNALAENIAYLYEHQPTATPIFDGTINIESGNTTISGSYLIDESKVYNALRSLSGVKTYKVNFSAGGSGSGMGDSIDFTSMTFDATSGLIKYNDKGAFAINGGFAEYNNNYGDGNGARVNFAEGTECRKEFKELFLSIADEYTEPVDDSIVGTWLFNNSVVAPDTSIIGIGSTSSVSKLPIGSLTYIVDGVDNNRELLLNDYYSQVGYNIGIVLNVDYFTFCRKIESVSGSINSSINYSSLRGGTLIILPEAEQYVVDTNFASWLQANATKQ